MRKLTVSVLVAFLWSNFTQGEDDVADVPSQNLLVNRDKDKRYFLIGPGTKTPKGGFGLIVVLPGGDGGANFHAFVKRIYKHALPKNYLVVQPVAVKWTPPQKITWPTAKNKVAAQKFSTEKLVRDVIVDVSKRHKLDRKRIFSLSWSSGGPAAYAVSLQKQRLVRGSFVAMSVFQPKQLPSLKSANKHAYYLLHSPTDGRCPFPMAQNAESLLKQNGARTQLVTYRGGHGWKGNVYGQIKDGIRWLEANSIR